MTDALKTATLALHMQVRTTTKLLDIMVAKGLISNAEASATVLEMLDDFNEDLENAEMGDRLQTISQWLEKWVASFAEASIRERKD